MAESLKIEELLENVKNYLDITWDSCRDDDKLIGIIERGISYIDDVAGSAQDYNTTCKAQELLFDYVRYVRSNALDEFRKNYLPEILHLQIAERVKNYDQRESADV